MSDTIKLAVKQGLISSSLKFEDSVAEGLAFIVIL